MSLSTRFISTVSFAPLNPTVDFLYNRSCWKCKHSFLDMRLGLKCKKFLLPYIPPKRGNIPLYSNNYEYTHRCRLDEKKCGYMGIYYETNEVK